MQLRGYGHDSLTPDKRIPLWTLVGLRSISLCAMVAFGIAFTKANAVTMIMSGQLHLWII